MSNVKIHIAHSFYFFCFIIKTSRIISYSFLSFEESNSRYSSIIVKMIASAESALPIVTNADNLFFVRFETRTVLDPILTEFLATRLFEVYFLRRGFRSHCLIFRYLSLIFLLRRFTFRVSLSNFSRSTNLATFDRCGNQYALHVFSLYVNRSIAVLE